VISYISPLVQGASLHRCKATEDLVHGRRQGLRAVHRYQQAVLSGQPATDQVGEHRLHDSLVLRRAVPQPDRELRTTSGDRQRDDDAPAGHVLTVEHQDLDVLARQVPGEQLGQGRLGLLHEPPGHRRTAGRGRRFGEGFADRLGDPGVPLGRDAREHPLQHDLREQVVGGEVRVGLQRHLIAVHGSGAGPGARDPTTSERDRTLLGAVPHGRAGRVVLALRAGHSGDLGLEHRLHHRHPGRHAQREQSLPRHTHDVGQRHAQRLGQISQP